MNCTACGEKGVSARRVAMRSAGLGWFSTDQPMCSECYQSHLEALPTFMPYRTPEQVQFVPAGIVVVGEDAPDAA